MRLRILGLTIITMSLGLFCPAQDVYNGCGMEGSAKQDSVKTLNGQKNRYKAPSESDFDHDVTLKAILHKGADDDRFDWHKAASIEGYIYNVKVGGNETCNCHATDPEFRDTHIEVTLGPDDSGKTRRVIVEVTPRWRAKMKEQGIDWSTDALKEKFKGHWATMEGWLLFDEEHRPEAENTNPGNHTNWRATCWELHPVTKIEIKNDSGKNDESSSESSNTHDRSSTSTHRVRHHSEE